MNHTHNDLPISTPVEDRYGINPFAEALARSIRDIKAPRGSVIALNGHWGSGKSSAVNLIRYHLDDAIKAKEIKIIDFTCWWFRGEEALALAFFSKLNTELSQSIGKKLKKALPKLWKQLLKNSEVFGSVADLAFAGGAGGITSKIIGKIMEWFSKLIPQDESVEKLYADLLKALEEQGQRFLVVIDDIDRLSPDEALLIFRLVKSVGRLPKVMYLLVYDRQLAEKTVRKRFPSEGHHYLEKIVQAAFELPEPQVYDLQNHLWDQIKGICGELPHYRKDRFQSIFYEGVAPEMRTPRYVGLFTNSLAVTWPAVANEVDVADFFALEILRLLHPDIYRAVRQNKNILCNSSRIDRKNDNDQLVKHYEDLFLRTSKDIQRERIRKILMRLFPVLEDVWENRRYANGFALQWAKERRVCSAHHFDMYFRFTIGTEVISVSELEALIARAGDPGFVIGELLKAVTVTRPAGGTRAAVILDELNWHADKVKKEFILPFLTCLFKNADEINVPADNSGIVNNSIRLHSLLWSLTKDRMSIEERSAVYLTACQSASIGWLADFAESVWIDHYPSDGYKPKPVEQCLTTASDAQVLREMLLNRITDAAKSGELLGNMNLMYLLYRWRAISNDDGAAVREWTTLQLTLDENIRRFAIAFTSHHSASDRPDDQLGRIRTVVHVDGLEQIMNKTLFRQRVEEIAATGVISEVVEFLAAWQRHEQGKR